MKTYKLTTEKEIRDMMQQALMLDELSDYLSSLTEFFTQKAKDLAQALSGDEKDEDVVFKKYRNFNVKPSDVIEAIEDMETARHLYNLLPSKIERVVKKELENPTTVEIPDDADEDDIAAALIDIDSEIWNKYINDFAPKSFNRMTDHTYGHKMDDRFREFERHYGLID